MIQLPGLRDCERSLRHPRPECLVDHSEIDRHGNGRGFIGAGVVILPVYHDDDRNQPRFARARELNQSESARSRVRRLPRISLRQFLRPKRAFGRP